MASDTIVLDCPGCNEVLEIDSGFAGGVCRCSSCGTLMTVPADPSRERAERLHRPASPTSRPGKPGQITTPEEDLAQIASSQAEVYTTDSGKVVKVRSKSIPTARKRKVVRISVYAVFLLIVVVVVGAVFLAASLMMKATSTAPPDPNAVQTVESGATYSADVNPFIMRNPNCLGIPLSKHTAVAIDGSGDSYRWWEHASAAIVAGLKNLQPEMTYQVVMWQDGGPTSFPSGLEHIDEGMRSQLESFLKGASLSGAADPGPAIEAALDDGPRHLIIVTGQQLNATQIEQILSQLEDESSLRIDVVTISANMPPELAQLAESHKGHAVELARTQLRLWMEDAADEAANQASPAE